MIDLLAQRIARLLGVLTVAGLAGACAADYQGEGVYDPLEPMNRVVFEFNYYLDSFVLEPAAIAYRDVTPDPLKDRIHDFLTNVHAPVVLINDLLQGEFARAERTAARFFVNTTAGVGGLIDIASSVGIESHDEDFGQTLAVWGVDSGPYLVLPLFGPSNFRDGIGIGVDMLFNPMNWWFWFWDGPATMDYVLTGLTLLDQRSRAIKALDELEKGSVDFYATLRSAYTQRRRAEILNGETGGQYDLLDYGFDYDTEVPTDLDTEGTL